MLVAVVVLDEDEVELSDVLPAPRKRIFTVVQGAITVSSWSIPIIFAPFVFSTPMTLNTTF